MRVLLTNHFPLEGSGSGIYTSNVARELVAAGHAALTITPEHDPPGPRPFETRAILFQGPGGLPFNFPCFTTHPRSRTTFYELSDGQIDAYRAAWVRAIEAAVHDFRPDLIHAQHLWLATAVALDTGRPVVATCHGTDLMGFDRDPRYHGFARRAASGARRIVAISRAIDGQIRQAFAGVVDPSRIRIVGNGFDDALFREPEGDRTALRSSLGVPAGVRRLVVFAGKLADFKGADVLLDAAAIYEREDPGLVTVLIGDGELRGDLEARASRLALSRVRFLGHHPQTELARWFQAADVAVFPSRREPFGLVAIEAMACGTPVVATDEGGLPDFVSPEVGELVPVDDAPTLAAAVRRQADEKERKGPIAARRAAAKHSWRSRVAETVTLAYEEALAG